jgi:hypothetical protein
LLGLSGEEEERISMKTYDEHPDYWAEEEFEDTVAAALIACFETKAKKNRGAPPADRMTEERLAALRAEGPYVASNSRLLEVADEGEIHGVFDIVNDRLPLKGCHAFLPRGLVADSLPNAYFCAHYVRQSKTLGHGWYKRKGGTLYEMLEMSAENDGVDGERRFFTVTKQGEVVACNRRFSDYYRGSPYGEKRNVIGHAETWLRETGIWAGIALQLLADRRHCWTITAQEKVARAHLGCMMEEVKSLLYARSLPMTATGRKRPILHLVESHKRRMRSGIDINVTAFLRGQQTVEMGGTVFKVNPPATLRPEVSKPSRERYFAAVDA